LNRLWGDSRDAVGFVLAGGESSRMGRDKALVEFKGQFLIARAVAVLREAGLEVAIAGAHSALEPFAPIVHDAEPGLGPLSGICAALRATPTQHAVFLSVDLPLLPTGLIEYLLFHASTTGRAVTLASVAGFPQTFPVILLRSVLPVLEKELRTGRRGCFAAFQGAADELGELLSILPVETMAQSGHVSHPDTLPASRWFLNINSEVDLRRAAANLRPRIE
jgi:molybdopterin-guanine dinucleotide biosynthesis protein A